MSQVWRRSEVGNHKRRTINTRLSSGTPEHTSSSSQNVPGRMIRSDLFWYWNKIKMKPTYRDKNLQVPLHGGKRKWSCKMTCTSALSQLQLLCNSSSGQVPLPEHAIFHETPHTCTRCSCRMFRVPGGGPDQLNRCKEAAAGSVLTSGHPATSTIQWVFTTVKLHFNCDWKIEIWKKIQRPRPWLANKIQRPKTVAWRRRNAASEILMTQMIGGSSIRSILPLLHFHIWQVSHSHDAWQRK